MWIINRALARFKICFENFSTRNLKFIFGFKECENPYQCRNDDNGEGLKLCRAVPTVGGLCDEDDNCEKGLKCTPYSWYRKNRCYDETKVLNIGDKCDPNAKGDEKQCVGPNRLACLPKGSQHVCQGVASLHEACSPSKNIICEHPSLSCDKTLKACI